MAEHKVDIDWEKAGTLGVSVPAIQRTISTAFGSAYINDFIQGGTRPARLRAGGRPLPDAARTI